MKHLRKIAASLFLAAAVAGCQETTEVPVTDLGVDGCKVTSTAGSTTITTNGCTIENLTAGVRQKAADAAAQHIFGIPPTNDKQ